LRAARFSVQLRQFAHRELVEGSAESVLTNWAENEERMLDARSAGTEVCRSRRSTLVINLTLVTPRPGRSARGRKRSSARHPRVAGSGTSDGDDLAKNASSPPAFSRSSPGVPALASRA